MVFTRTQIIYRRCDAVEVGLRPPLGGYTGPHSGWGKRVVVFIAGRAIDPSSGGRPVSLPIDAELPSTPTSTPPIVSATSSGKGSGVTSREVVGRRGGAVVRGVVRWD